MKIKCIIYWLSFVYDCCDNIAANGKGLCEVRATATESGEENQSLAKTFSIF